MYQHKWCLVLALVLIVTLVSVPPVRAAEIIIDDFENANVEILHQIPSSPSFPYTLSQVSGSGVSGVLGGQRDVCLQLTAGNVNDNARFRTDEDNDYLSMGLDGSVRGRGYVQWDGATNTNCTLDHTGLGSVDLTSGGTNTGLLIRIIYSDGVRVDIKARIFNNATNWMERSVALETAVAVGNVVDLFFPFASFTVQGGSLTQAQIAAAVGAIEVEIDGATNSTGADITVDLIKTTGAYEYGDLPLINTNGLPVGQTGFSTDMLNARHIPLGMRLGLNVDTEATHNASFNASGDDLHGYDDEDGVTRVGILDQNGDPTSEEWSVESGGVVKLVWNGCATSGGNRCRIHGWIDWNRDGIFQPAERLWGNNGASGTTPFTGSGQNFFEFEIPNGTEFSNIRYYARFRICPSSANACNSPDATNVLDGEIEDYAWDWGNVPLAVTLADFSAAWEGAGIRVTWETATELDNLGFNLYRGDSAAGPWTQLNAELIPAQHPGAVFGARYEWLDADVTPGTTYYYRLEDVDIYGVSTFHGPIQVAPTEPSAVSLSAFGARSPLIGLALVFPLGWAVWRKQRRTRNR